MTAGGNDVSRTRTRTMVVLGMVVLVLLFILLAAGTIPRIENHRALAKTVADTQNEVRAVYVTRPVRSPEAGLTLAATTQAIQDTVIFARTSGYLRKRYVDIGDNVTEGQLLALIESPEVDQQLGQAEADLETARKNLELQKAALELARVTMERYQSADKEGSVAKLLLDQSVSTFRTSQASVAAATAVVASNEANVRRLQDLVSFERVLSPFTGTIIQRSVDTGALITAGSPVNNVAAAPSSVAGGANGLFEVAQMDELRIFVSVPQTFAPNVKVGLPVKVTVRGRLMEPVTGRVTRTATALDPGTRTLLTQVDVPNRSRHVLAGMFVYVDFEIAPSGTRWRVPATAVVFNAQGTRVAIVDKENKLHFQQVELGRDFGMSIDVQAGLYGNEVIVKQPTVSLQEGQLVRPIESTEQ
jgi:multidrug efflux pump subunit AcrA (membrane-fusion protein)